MGGNFSLKVSVLQVLSSPVNVRRLVDYDHARQHFALVLIVQRTSKVSHTIWERGGQLLRTLRSFVMAQVRYKTRLETVRDQEDDHDTIPKLRPCQYRLEREDDYSEYLATEINWTVRQSLASS